MSWSDMSPYECSVNPGPKIKRPLWHNDPGLKHPCHYALYNTFRLVQSDRDGSMQRHCVSGTIHLGDQGSQKIRAGTHRFGTSRHPTVIFEFCFIINSELSFTAGNWLSDCYSLNTESCGFLCSLVHRFRNNIANEGKCSVYCTTGRNKSQSTKTHLVPSCL